MLDSLDSLDSLGPRGLVPRLWIESTRREVAAGIVTDTRWRLNVPYTAPRRVIPADSPASYVITRARGHSLTLSSCPILRPTARTSALESGSWLPPLIEQTTRGWCR